MAANRRKAANPWTLTRVYEMFRALQSAAKASALICLAASSRCWPSAALS